MLKLCLPRAGRGLHTHHTFSIPSPLHLPQLPPPPVLLLLEVLARSLHFPSEIDDLGSVLLRKDPRSRSSGDLPRACLSCSSSSHVAAAAILSNLLRRRKVFILVVLSGGGGGGGDFVELLVGDGERALLRRVREVVV